ATVTTARPKFIPCALAAPNTRKLWVVAPARRLQNANEALIAVRTSRGGGAARKLPSSSENDVVSRPPSKCCATDVSTAFGMVGVGSTQGARGEFAGGICAATESGAVPALGRVELAQPATK